MKKSIKKLIALLCAMTMLLSLVTIVAADAEQTYVWFEAENFKAGNLGLFGGYAEASYDPNNLVYGTSLNDFSSVAYANGKNTDGADTTFVEYDFNVDVAGNYDFWMLALPVDKAWLSTYTYEIDGSSAKAVAASGLPGIYNSLANNWTTWTKLGTEDLTADEHTLHLNVLGRSSDSKPLTVIDCFAVVPSDWGWTPSDQYTKPVKTKSNYIWLEAESYASSTKVGGTTMTGNDGNDHGMIFYWAGAVGDGTATYNISVPETDAFDVWVLATRPDLDWMSDYTYSIDNGEEISSIYSFRHTNGSLGKGTIYGNANSYVYSLANHSSKAPFMWVRMPSTVIEKGNHTFTLKFPGRASDGKVVGGVDKVVLAPTGWGWTPSTYDAKPVDYNNGFWIEAEHFYKNSGDSNKFSMIRADGADITVSGTVFSNSAASGSFFMNQYALSGTITFENEAPELTYKFKPSTTGNYDIYIISYKNQNHVSPLKYSLDNSEFSSITDATGYEASSVAITKVYTYSRGGEQGLYVNKIPVTLSADNVHTLVLRSDEARPMGGMYLNAVDAIAVVPSGRTYTLPTGGTYGEMYASFEAGMFGFSDTNSDKINLPTRTPAGNTITWASSNENVITSNGAVTRPEAGYPAVSVALNGTITATAAGNSSLSGTANLPSALSVTVLPKLSAYDAAISYTDGVNAGSVIEASAVIDATEDGQSVTIIVAYYDAAGKLVVCSPAVVSNIVAELDRPVRATLTIPENAAGGTAKMFLWTNMSDIRPIEIVE